MLSQVQREKFYEEGFLKIPGLFSLVEVQQMRAAFSRLRELAYRLKRTQSYRDALFVLEPVEEDSQTAAIAIHRIVWCGGAEPILKQLGQKDALRTLAGSLLGSKEVVHLINQAHFKIPGDEVAFDWHQDCLHRRYGTDLWTDVNGQGSFVQVCTAVDPMEADNGPIQIVPGSCRVGALPVDPVTRSLPSGCFDPADIRDVLLEPGDALLLGPYTIHGSQPNRSDRSRRLFVNGFSYPGANRRVYPGAGLGEALALP